MTWTKPTYVEITGAEAQAIRADVRRQAFNDRECFGCLAPLRDRTSTYCSRACAEEMGDPGDVDLPALVVNLAALLFVAPAMKVQHHAAATA
jgi:hypothetical protein